MTNAVSAGSQLNSVHTIPNLGVNYPNRVMGPLMWVTGCLFLLAFNHNIFYGAETGTGKTGPTIALINVNRQI